ncbi:MAG: hypothetical protein HC886_19040 [Leptolyngbyaceae cyanobacterium SM1_1_3]|nr:hypothetical protein [Leptolyngbyaceae cyanobacterium SM1_1_3]
MNRSPRRPPRIQLPLWGRLSAPPLGKNQIMAAVRQRSPVSSRHTGVIKVVEPCDRIDPDWLASTEAFQGCSAGSIGFGNGWWC